MGDKWGPGRPASERVPRREQGCRRGPTNRAVAYATPSRGGSALTSPMRRSRMSRRMETGTAPSVPLRVETNFNVIAGCLQVTHQPANAGRLQGDGRTRRVDARRLQHTHGIGLQLALACSRNPLNACVRVGSRSRSPSRRSRAPRTAGIRTISAQPSRLARVLVGHCARAQRRRVRPEPEDRNVAAAGRPTARAGRGECRASRSTY